MKREIAEKMTGVLSKIDEMWNDLYWIIDEIDDEDENKKLKRAVLRLIGDMHVKITLEAVRDFPELHPDPDPLRRSEAK
jgi:hypothetical protein